MEVRRGPCLVKKGPLISKTNDHKIYPAIKPRSLEVVNISSLSVRVDKLHLGAKHFIGCCHCHRHHQNGYRAHSHHDKIPPWWGNVSNDKGGKMSVTKSHHTWKILLGVCMFQSIPYNNGRLPNVQFSNWCPWGQICSLLYNSTPSRTLPTPLVK